MSQCEIFILERPFSTQNKLSKSFARLAQTQKNSFVDIFPWRVLQQSTGKRNKEMVMIVAATRLRNNARCGKAPSKDTVICGWLTAMIDSKYNHVYLAEISAISATKSNAQFRGIGKKLFDELVRWCNAHDKDFIYLLPYSQRVKDLYEQKWGLRSLAFIDDETGVKHSSRRLFYPLKVLPDAEWLRKEELENNFTVDDFDFLQEELSEAHCNFMRDLKDNNPSLFDEILQEIQGFVAICDDQDEREQVIKDYMEKCVAQYKI